MNKTIICVSILLCVFYALIHTQAAKVKYPPSRTKFDSHIISQKTWNNLQKSPNLTAALNNYGNWAQARQPKPKPSSRYQPPTINQKPIHSFIIGPRSDVSNSLLSGRRLPAQGPKNLNNYFESTKPFPQVTVKRNRNGGVTRVTNTGTHLFGGANVGRKPVHYEAGYLGGRGGLSDFNSHQTGNGMWMFNPREQKPPPRTLYPLQPFNSSGTVVYPNSYDSHQRGNGLWMFQ